MPSPSRHGFPETTVIGAHYLAGFQTDLTSWSLVIDEQGRLIQTLLTFGRVSKKARHAVVQLDNAQVLEWVAQADALDFSVLQDAEQHLCIDDTSSYTLLCHLGPVQKSITLRTLDSFVQQGHPDMIAFQVLWDSIHAVAPFPQTRRSWLAK